MLLDPYMIVSGVWSCDNQIVERHKAVLDASFWINVHRTQLVEHVPDYFSLIVPTRVVEEIEYTPPDITQRIPPQVDS